MDPELEKHLIDYRSDTPNRETPLPSNTTRIPSQNILEALPEKQTPAPKIPRPQPKGLPELEMA